MKELKIAAAIFVFLIVIGIGWRVHDRTRQRPPVSPLGFKILRFEPKTYAPKLFEPKAYAPKPFKLKTYAPKHYAPKPYGKSRF